MSHATNPTPKPDAQRDAEKLVIIGSGPAGWTAALYAARAQLEPLCVVGVPKQDPGPVLPGGQLMLTNDVENYPGFPEGIPGPKMMALFQQQAERFGTRTLGDDVTAVRFHEDPATPHELTCASGRTLRAHAVIIATGATANWLGLENELRLARSGGGVSACAVCDGALPMFRNNPVAVVGGGDTAMEEAHHLSKFASTVYVIHRRDQLRASKVMQERTLSKPNVKMIWNSIVVDVLDRKDPASGADVIRAVLLEDTVTKARRELEVNGLFVAIGHTPATGFLKNSGLELDQAGYVRLHSRSSQTNIPGVFAAGDVADPRYRQAVTAAGMGCQAALDAEHWLGAHALA
ncbi:MAG: thioredoxin reductase [Phycisphaerales bacterium]|nr:MAG: thioredoxin reductase [Phycisphaerales bacterium]